MSVFDGNWTVTYTASNDVSNALRDADADSVVVGNGKICMFPSYSGVDMQRTLITMRSQTSRETAFANTVDAFTTHKMLFYAPDAVASPLPLQLVSKQLNMYTGIFTARFECPHPAYPMTIEYDLYACRHFPFSSVMTLRITPGDDFDLGLQHETVASSSLSDSSFKTSSIYNEVVATQGAVYFVEGEAGVTLTGDRVAVSSTYVHDGSAITNLGFNVYRSDPRRCYNRFQTSVTSGTVLTMHIISTQMTSVDYEQPDIEARRVCMNMVLRSSTPLASVSQIRSDHISAWAALWKGRVAITPKLGITGPETASLNSITRVLKSAFYNIYSTTRENAVPASPLPGVASLNAVDLYGSVALDGDLWLVPCLLLFRPEAARAILEFRYKELASAIQLASTYGFKGARYPYTNDSVGFKDAVYWDVLSPLHVFNTALVAISAWNYYRITLDDEWLRSQGYPILKNIADFFASKVSEDEDGTLHLRQVSGLDPAKRAGDDETMTNYLVRLATKYTIEASYQVGAYVKEQWTDVFYGLPVTVFPNTHVLALNAEADSDDTSSVLETLIPLLPYFNYVLYKVDTFPCAGATTAASNLAFWETKTNPGYEGFPTNALMRAILHAQVAQNTTNTATRDASLAAFETILSNIVNDYVTPIWTNLPRFDSDKTYNDITLSALLILVVVMGSVGVNIKGGVAETRFYYENFKVDGLVNSIFPRYWKDIVVGGLSQAGDAARTFTSTNILTYPA